MRRALIYVVFLALGVAGVLYMARLGGAVQIRFGDFEIAVHFAVALLLLAAAFLILHLILSGFGALRRWPGRMRARREVRRRGDGDAAVTRALVALAAGTPELARVEVRRARLRVPGPRRQAPLALAASGLEPEGGRAAELERQAFQTDPGFAPAALAHAKRLRDTGSPRRARQVLEEAWKRRPHPDVATAYLGDEADPLQRVRSAEQLAHGNPKHPESHLLIGRVAIEAGLTGRARQELEALNASGLADRRVYLALSDLEEAEGGDTPHTRAAQARWLRMAATAAPEPRWRCSACGTDQPAWTPVCPHCQSVGTIGWTSPQQLPVAAG